MSHLYNMKFDQMRNNAPEKDGGSQSVIFHKEPSFDRRLCLVHLDSRRLSLNYSFMINLEYDPVQNAIFLEFTTHWVTLGGLALDKLFEAFEQSLPQKIICKDARYNTLVEQGQIVVNKIEVISKM